MSNTSRQLGALVTANVLSTFPTCKAQYMLTLITNERIEHAFCKTMSVDCYDLHWWHGMLINIDIKIYS